VLSAVACHLAHHLWGVLVATHTVEIWVPTLKVGGSVLNRHTRGVPVRCEVGSPKLNSVLVRVHVRGTSGYTLLGVPGLKFSR